MIRLTVIEPPWPLPALYAQLVAAAFSQRRKTLRNAVRRYLTAEQIEALGIDPGLRPERLAPHDFARLAEAAALSSTVTLARSPPAVFH
jgi:16S rRNA (adenine1518-N6/adenine1519-N6)-dimethyltransferase